MYRYFFLILFAAGLFFSNSAAANSPDERKVVIKTKGKPVLGVLLTGLDDDELKNLSLPGGAKIKKVLKESEAERMGLKAGDIIVKFDGSDVAGPLDLHEMISEIEDEKKVEIVIVRDGKEQKLEASLKPGDKGYTWRWGDYPDLEFRLKDLPYHFGRGLRSDTKGGFLGVEARELTDQLKQYFEVEHGVLIEKVMEESPAEKAGLKAGDVITGINGRKIEDYRDLVRTVGYYNPGETVEIKYTRRGKSNSVKVELGERKKMKWQRVIPDVEDRIERNLDKSMRHLEDEMKGLKNNLQNIETNFVVIQ